MDLNSLLVSISLFDFKLNWLDLLVIAIVVFYAFEGYAIGFLSAFLDLISFVASFILGLILYGLVSGLITGIFPIPHGIANAIGFFVVALLSELILSFVLRELISNMPFYQEFKEKSDIYQMVNKYLGIFPAVLSALLLLSFIFTLIISLPLSSFLKKSVSDSEIGGNLVLITQGLAKDINDVFGGAVDDTLSFLTVAPRSEEVVKLNIKTDKVTVDEKAETEMLVLVNRERRQRGQKALERSDSLRGVARDHCRDMFRRGYFSHYTLEGLSPFDRMAEADINFVYAGENLALAPNVDLAMQGLMKSPGHRANILSGNFGKVGIGVIDGGVYGQMYCQEFTD